MPGLTQGTPIVLGKVEKAWKIMLFGLDSSQSAKYSAQGFAPLQAIDDLRKGSNFNDDIDLAILLLHHHLLPIAALEKQNQSISGLLNPTVMLNAGTLLETLTDCNINLALHGHEHEHFTARYRTVNGLQNEATIVAAGSSTGAQTLKPCEPSKASFNVFELNSDRTIWLKDYRNSALKWVLHNTVKLYGSGELRRMKLSRAKSTIEAPTSCIVKNVEFTEGRDILIREIKTNWVVEGGKFTNHVFNSTGIPISESVTFEWADKTKSLSLQQYVVADTVDHLHTLEIDLKTNSDLYASRITIDTKWDGGGLLTANDLAMVEKSKRGIYRNRGIETTTVEINQPLAMLTIILSIPEEFVVDADDFKVIADEVVIPQNMPKDAITVSDDKELTIEHLGVGKFMLTVPYPSLGVRYGIGWELKDLIANDKVATEFANIAKLSAGSLLRAFSAGLPTSVSDSATISLYIPEQKTTRTGLVAVLPHIGRIVGEHTNLPKSIRLDDFRSPYTKAYWGNTTLEIRDGTSINEEESKYLLNGEVALLTLPIRGLDNIGVPWAVVRLGFFGKDCAELKEEFAKPGGPLADSRISLLNELMKIKGEK